MTRLRYGSLVGIAGAALTLYRWWRRRPDYVARQMSLAGQGDLGGRAVRGVTDHPSRGAVV
jgi:hypothetical protein